ncbi:substrate-binding domain-containing protein [Xylophilus sp. GOD-11R]|uniref:LacI family DNA-binding transcriptional regulator n=1 Tax=Xylophilus sp. GOD-11R TaxID=3089814 RepID=UPI00298BEC1A|nr:substrate-binding domain-containing protein [Xylophilus sp. GOD-11R]WPB56074.1 substrate-binding domain-containing protein [Xylophilus sp. GOD-11R]
MKARPTIRDVAHAAGVSLGTASRALNRSGRVSEDAVAKVSKAARQLGYEPDAIAQSMRTRSTGVIGVLVSDFANPLYARILTSIETELQRAGYTLLLASTHNDSKREKALIDLFRRRRIDGLVLGPCESESPEFIERLSAELPLVALDRDFSPASTGIQVDHYHGALQATRHLLNLGHQRIALMTPGRELRPGRERIAGFTDAYRERGLQPDPKLIRAEKSAMEFAFSEALALLSGPLAPTAFVCLGTRILAGVLQSLRHSGRSVPEDASVISVGDADLAQLFNPAITALAWDLEAMGRVIVQLMLKRLDSKATPEPERIVITTQLILRDSCAPHTGVTRAARTSQA